jgi:hypothetical protein
VYLRHDYEDERLVDERLRQLEGRSDIELRIPVTDARWQTSRRDTSNTLAKRAGTEYDQPLLRVSRPGPGGSAGAGPSHASGQARFARPGQLLSDGGSLNPKSYPIALLSECRRQRGGRISGSDA